MTTNILILLAITFFASLWYGYIFDKKLSLNGDNLTYYLLGQSLATGKGYTEIWTAEHKAHTQYPPGYPLLIAAVLRIMPYGDLTPVPLVKILNGLFFIGTVIFLFFLFGALGVERRFFPILLLPLVTNAHILGFAHIMMSEMPFLFITIATLYGVTRIDFSAPFYKSRMLYAVIAGLVLAMYFRTQGIALVAAFLMYLLIQRKFNHALWVGLLCGVLILPWTLWVQSHGGSSYIQQLFMVNPYNQDEGTVGFAQLFGRVFVNASRYVASEIPSACFPSLTQFFMDHREFGRPVGILIILLSVFGLRKIPSHRSLLVLYLAATFAMLLLWPSVWFGVRFIIGIIPFIWLLFIIGICNPMFALLEREDLYHRAVPFVLSLLFAVHIPALYRMHRDAKAPYPPSWQNYFRIARWIRENTPEETVTSCRKSGFFYLFSRRPTCVYLFSEDNAKLIVDMVNKGVDYIVVDQLGYATTPKYLIPAIFQNPEFFESVLRLRKPDTFLFRINSEYDPDNKKDVAGAVLLVMALRRYKMNHFTEAEKLIKKALHVTRESVGTKSKVYANALNNLGIIEVARKDYIAARSLFEQSVAIEQELMGENHPEIARSLINIAEMYKGEKKFEKADSLFKRAISIQERVYGPGSMDLVQSLYIYLKFFITWGKQEKADSLFVKLISIVDNLEKKIQKEVVPFLDKLRVMYEEQGREEKSEKLAQVIAGIKDES